MKEQFRRHCTVQDPLFKDVLFGLLALVFFVVLLALTPAHGGTANAQALTSGATSKTYPYIIGAAGTVVSLILIVTKLTQLLAVCREEAAKAAAGQELEALPEKENVRWKTVLLCVVMMFVLNIALIKLGVILGGFLYLLAQILILTAKKDLTKKNIIIAVAISILVPLAIYFPFTYIFKAKIPMGIFR